eukprot:3626090-Ditylum_brightwellii.AAC.1
MGCTTGNHTALKERESALKGEGRANTSCSEDGTGLGSSRKEDGMQVNSKHGTGLDILDCMDLL